MAGRPPLGGLAAGAAPGRPAGLSRGASPPDAAPDALRRGAAALPPRPRSSLPRRLWLAALVVFLGAVYVLLHAWLVLPWLWPAGLGLRLAGESAYLGVAGHTALLIARPPDLASPPAPAGVEAVVPGGPAAAAGVRPGDRVEAWRSVATGVRVDLAGLGHAGPAGRLRAWRAAWRAGLQGPVELQLAGRGPALPPRTVAVDRPSAWASAPAIRRPWLDRHAGLLARALVFTACALVLLLLKGHDRTGAVAAAALAFCTVGATGPLLGSERVLPPLAGDAMLVFTWTATPLAFAFTALAIVFFPRPSALVVRRPWLLAVPFLVVSPMLAPSAATGLYLAGVEAAGPLALWDATHPGAFLLTFAAALLVNAATLGEAVWRYARNPDLHERRRIRLAIVTTVVGVLAFALRDGLPVVSSLVRGEAVEWPAWAGNLFHALIVLPALGVTYAVVVHRVLGPRMALRRSLQYALTRRTLAVVAALPAVLLVWSLVRRRHEPLADIVSGAPAFYLGLLALSVAALRYRERAGQWLDARFFRSEYDARRVLLSLAGRVRFETDPAALTDLVLREIEQALHPRWAAFLAAGLEAAQLVPVATRGGAAAPLAGGGGLATLLTWSDRPLEIDLADPQSVEHRLPSEEREWLESTGAVLLVPVVGLDRQLAGVIALGEKRSEEPYTSEDRELLASLAGQVALGFDVARLRVRLATAGELPTVAAPASGVGGEPALVECPRCGRCADERTVRCPDDGETMRRVRGLTRVVERKYRIDRLIGRGREDGVGVNFGFCHPRAGVAETEIYSDPVPSRLSSSAMAASSCWRRTGWLVPSSWRARLARARRTDSCSRCLSGSLTAVPPRRLRSCSRASICSWSRASASTRPSPESLMVLTRGRSKFRFLPSADGRNRNLLRPRLRLPQAPHAARSILLVYNDDGIMPFMDLFHPAVGAWFTRAFPEATPAQKQGWPVIARGESALILAPTGSGKTLAAFLWCLDRLMFEPLPPPAAQCRVLYVSPLKALAVDVERNLRAPLVGITGIARDRGDRCHLPAIAVRTGDTPADERARFQREPADILITTPESLYLLLTSNAREALRAVDTVIIDEIHALVPSKRGAHLALSIERLEKLAGRRLQRIGLSATVRPTDEVARFLGGVDRPPAREAAWDAWPATGTTTGSQAAGALDPRGAARPGTADPGDMRWRPVTLVDAGRKKTLELTLEVPVEDMARLDEPVAVPSGPAAQGPARPSIWTAVHPRLLDLVRTHRSTLIFVNSRRLAERLAAALNDLAGETLVLAHHGSLARAQRLEVEDRLKSGRLRGLVATSSLELGIDMGAIDLVVQVEAPPSVASGLQRIGRAGHHVDAPSRGVIVPKYRGDLVACAAATRAMLDGHVEATRYPRMPLDVLAQQVVAMAAMDRWTVDDLYDTVRRAAPYAGLGRAIFERVLDMLSGRYPSDDFAELRPRLTWDRTAGTIVAREGARRVAVINGGTIPDRGLYGVFLVPGAAAARSASSLARTGTGGPGGGPAGRQGATPGAARPAAPGAARVGELDEEMVFESRVGETFVLGASTWRIEEITHDRVLVSPAPGEPGKMPFWKGDAAGRPLEFGRAIGALVRTLDELPAATARERLVRDHRLDPLAADNLLQYLRDQKAATRVLPDDQTILVERCRDELGDWRVCVLSPFGNQVLAPWALAAAARVREETGLVVETMWTDDGFVVRFPETERPPETGWLVPPPEEVERLVVAQLGSSPLLAATFRESAARALLLPRRRPGARTPLWQQRKRAADLLAVAARFGDFPILLEAYRECLRDIFDLPALVSLLADIRDGAVRLVTVDTATPSPFAASLLFGYVATYLYDGDVPLAERRAQALAIDHAQLRELVGEAELRDLLDADVLDAIERQLQHLEPDYRARSADGLHDLLLRLGDLSAEAIAARTAGSARAWTAALLETRRAIELRIAGERRLVAVEDAARYRDALGTPLPPGLPESLLAPVADPLGDLVLRYARTHAPFTAGELAARYGLGQPVVEEILRRLTAAGRLLEGAFRPGGREREWCAPDVLAALRRRARAHLRREIEPVEAPVLARLVTAWQGTTKPRPGLDALLDAIERLQGAPLVASALETEILPARVVDFDPAALDTLLAAGEVVWVGLEPLGERDGRLALFLTDHLPRLWRPRPLTAPLPPREQACVDALRRAGASFFAPLHEAAGGGYPGETLDALWSLVWKGIVTNDALHALRAYLRPPGRDRRAAARSGGRAFRSRRTVPPSAEGRWSLLESRLGARPSDTAWSAAVAEQLLARYGVVSREVAAAEGLEGGFSGVYDVLRALEERGRIRRGYFVAGVGALQFALPAALDLLRAMRIEPEEPEVVRLSATDPANPYGAILRWPVPDGTDPSAARGPTRSAGATVVLVNGRLGAWVSRSRQILTFLPETEPERTIVARGVAAALADLARTGEGRQGGLLVAEINGMAAATHPLAPFLEEAGFAASALGFLVRREPGRHPAGPAAAHRGAGEWRGPRRL